VNVEQYAYQLPESIHVLQFEGFDLSTKDSLLHLKNLRIAPRSGMSRSLLFDLHFPDFKIKGIDYMKALLLKELNIENIVLTGPDLKFQNLLGQSDSPKAVFTVKDLFDNIKPHFKKVSVGHIQLKDGHLNLQPQLTIGSVSMDLLAINLSASTRTWSGIYRDISLNGRRISWSDDTFTATGNRARARLSKKNIQLCDWSIQYRHMDQWATTTFDTLILSGLEPAGFAGLTNPDQSGCELQH